MFAWQKLLSPDIQEFMQERASASIPELMLQRHKFPAEFPLNTIAEQIEARRKAQYKLPAWAKNPKVLFTSLSLEQCSSELTADFKRNILPSAKQLVDLSGGLGVDTSAFVQKIKEVIHVEPNEELQGLVQHNFEELELHNVSFFNQSALEFLEKTSLKPELAYLDPSRRKSGNKVFLLEDCEPSVKIVWNKLQSISSGAKLLVKLSPMLDIKSLKQDLPDTQKIWVVSVQNEVKELLLLLDKTGSQSDKMTEAINFLAKDRIEKFTFNLDEESELENDYQFPQKFLYEPNVAILKAGAFVSFGKRYALSKLHINSHLYTSNYLVDCPARRFEIVAVCPYQRKAVYQVLPNKQANITKRNFPESVATIRQKLKLREGGNYYLFATTLSNDKRAILVCQRA